MQAGGLSSQPNCLAPGLAPVASSWNSNAKSRGQAAALNDMRHSFTVILLSVTCLASSLFAEIPVTGKAVEHLKPFDEMMLKFMAEHQVVGASIAIAKDGKLLYSRGFGYADREKEIVVQPESLFRIASISKPITGVAIMQLIERGKLKLTDRVVDVLALEIPAPPKGDPRWRDITIAHLLHHTAGFDREKSFDPMFKAREFAMEQMVQPPAGPREVIACMLVRPLDFSPGERMAYSNFGYCLLGRVIEKVSGQGYEAYVKEHVLKPAGITQMRIGATRTTAPGEVKYYDRGGGKGRSVFTPSSEKPAAADAPYGTWHLEAMDSHGGWIASAVDLVKFASIARGEKLGDTLVLKSESIRIMFASPHENSALTALVKGPMSPAHYGCGWSVRVIGKKPPRINTWHNGGLAGTSTLLVRRHDGLDWAVLFNSDFAADGKWHSVRIDGLMHEAAKASGQ